MILILHPYPKIPYKNGTTVKRGHFGPIFQSRIKSGSEIFLKKLGVGFRILNVELDRGTRNPNPNIREYNKKRTFVKIGRFWCHFHHENCDFCRKYCTFEKLSRDGFVLWTVRDLKTLLWPPGGSEQLRLYPKRRKEF